MLPWLPGWFPCWIQSPNVLLIETDLLCYRHEISHSGNEHTVCGDSSAICSLRYYAPENSDKTGLRQNSDAFKTKFNNIDIYLKLNNPFRSVITQCSAHYRTLWTIWYHRTGTTNRNFNITIAKMASELILCLLRSTCYIYKILSINSQFSVEIYWTPFCVQCETWHMMTSDVCILHQLPYCRLWVGDYFPASA